MRGVNGQCACGRGVNFVRARGSMPVIYASRPDTSSAHTRRLRVRLNDASLSGRAAKATLRLHCPMHGMPADGTCFCAAFSSPIFFFFKSPSALSLSPALLFITVVVNASSSSSSSMRRCGRSVLLFFVAVVSCMGGAGVSESATQHLDTGRPGLRRATNCADHDPLCPARGFGGGAAAAATDDGCFILWLLGALCLVSDAMGLRLTVEGTEPRATGLG